MFLLPVSSHTHVPTVSVYTYTRAYCQYEHIHTCILSVWTHTYVPTASVLTYTCAYRQCQHIRMCILLVWTHTHILTVSVNTYTCAYCQCHHLHTCLLTVSSHTHVPTVGVKTHMPTVSVNTYVPTVSVNIHMCLLPVSSHAHVPTLSVNTHMCVSVTDFTPETSKRSRCCTSICCHFYWMINFLSWRHFRQEIKKETCSNKSIILIKNENKGSNSKNVTHFRHLTSHDFNVHLLHIQKHYSDALTYTIDITMNHMFCNTMLNTHYMQHASKEIHEP